MGLFNETYGRIEGKMNCLQFRIRKKRTNVGGYCIKKRLFIGVFLLTNGQILDEFADIWLTNGQI